MTHAHIAAAVAGLAGPRTYGPLTVIDVGCGNGLLLDYLAGQLPTVLPGRQLRIGGFDVGDSGHVVEGFPSSTREFLARQHPSVDWDTAVRATTVEASWPYEDNSIDIAVSNQVLEHVFNIQHFMNELRRTLKPGGTSVHVFPFERVLWENHLRMPLIHRARSSDARLALAKVWLRLGLGRYSRYQHAMSKAEYARMSSELLQLACYHRSWAVIAAAAHQAGLLASHRYTAGYYEQKLRAILGRRGIPSYRRPSQIKEISAFAVLPYIASGTIVLERPIDDTPWVITGAPL